MKRWKKKTVQKDGTVENGKYVMFKQPVLIHYYNEGGVDLHDNAVQNYRIHIRSKKWYWPLWISCLDSAIVSAWKLKCFVDRFEK